MDSSIKIGNILVNIWHCRSESQVLSASFWRGLHFSVASQRLKSRFSMVHRSSFERAQRDFFKHFDVLAPQNPKFRSPAGAVCEDEGVLAGLRERAPI